MHARELWMEVSILSRYPPSLFGKVHMRSKVAMTGNHIPKHLNETAPCSTIHLLSLFGK